jgi:hypothetical protein
VNEASAWRLEVARRLAPAYAANQPKTGVLIELPNHTTEFINRVLDDVLVHHDPSLLKQNLVAGIHQAVPLHGEDLLSAWKARTAAYPDGLAQAVVKTHAVIDHYWRQAALLERNRNLMLIHGTFAQVHQRLLHCLLAVNRCYYFGFKWLDEVVAHLRIAPPHLTTCIRRAYETDPVVAIRETARLVEQVYDLIETYVPGADVPWLRRVFRYQRPAWDHAPPGVL